MRDYAKVAPQFWMGTTGKHIRAAGIETQLLALYLITCPHASMIGIYYLPLAYIIHDTGLSGEGAMKALASLSKADFAHYDVESEWVWVVEMARYQIGEELDPKDKRVIGLNREMKCLHNCPFLQEFHKKYAKVFHLEKLSPSKGPSKPHRSQEQEQEQEQEIEQEQGSGELSFSPVGEARPSPPVNTKHKNEPHPGFTPKTLIAFYNTHLPDGIPRVETLSQERLKKAQRYLRQFPDPVFWETVMAEMGQSLLLRGLKPSPGHEHFRATFDWLLSKGKDGTENCVKVFEGRYRDVTKPQAPCAHSGAIPVAVGWYSCHRCGKIPEAEVDRAREAVFSRARGATA